MTKRKHIDNTLVTPRYRLLNMLINLPIKLAKRTNQLELCVKL